VNLHLEPILGSKRGCHPHIQQTLGQFGTAKPTLPDDFGLTWDLLPAGGLLLEGRSKICIESLDSKLAAVLKGALLVPCLEFIAAACWLPCRLRAKLIVAVGYRH